MSDFTYASIEDIPAETPIPLTEIDPAGGRYADYGKGMYCSECGTRSARLRRTELWAVRHSPSIGRHGLLNRYCMEHLPDREWADDSTGGHGRRVREVECSACFMLVPIGSICDATGQPHAERPA